MPQNPLTNLKPDPDGPSFFPSFQREMNRLLDHFRAGLPMPETSDEPFFGAVSFPAVDIVETDDAVEISAEVPGVQEENLEASISGGVLTLKGEKSSDHEEKDTNYHRIERRYGSFRRQIPLGFSPDDGAVTSDFNDGVLKLRIAKPAATKAGVTKIDIRKS